MKRINGEILFKIRFIIVMNSKMTKQEETCQKQNATEGIIFTAQQLKALSELFFPQSIANHHDSIVINRKLLACLRIFFAIYMTVVYIFLFIDRSSLLQQLLYFTNYSYFLVWLYFVFISQSYLRSHAYDFAICQVMFQIAFIYELIVVGGYWVIFYPYLLKQGLIETQTQLYFNFNVHLFPPFFLIIDYIFNTYRFIMYHLVFHLIVGLFYLIGINLPYALAVEPVYRIAMDWVNWYGYALLCACFIVSMLAFLLLNRIYTYFKGHLTIPFKAQDSASQQTIHINKTEAVMLSRENVSDRNKKRKKSIKLGASLENVEEV